MSPRLLKHVASNDHKCVLRGFGAQGFESLLCGHVWLLPGILRSLQCSLQRLPRPCWLWTLGDAQCLLAWPLSDRVAAPCARGRSLPAWPGMCSVLSSSETFGRKSPAQHSCRLRPGDGPELYRQAPEEPGLLAMASPLCPPRMVEHSLHMSDRMVIYFFIAASYTPW